MSLREELWGDSMAFENDRQILEDEEGLLMAPLVINAADDTAINPTVQGWRTPWGIHVGCRSRRIDSRAQKLSKLKIYTRMDW
jgi:hypothetical protein